ncbi:unnamed protein product [Lampetra fluviatilis]
MTRALSSSRPAERSPRPFRDEEEEEADDPRRRAAAHGVSSEEGARRSGHAAVRTRAETRRERERRQWRWGGGPRGPTPPRSGGPSLRAALKASRGPPARPCRGAATTRLPRRVPSLQSGALRGGAGIEA